MRNAILVFPQSKQGTATRSLKFTCYQVYYLILEGGLLFFLTAPSPRRLRFSFLLERSLKHDAMFVYLLIISLFWCKKIYYIIYYEMTKILSSFWNEKDYQISFRVNIFTEVTGVGLSKLENFVLSLFLIDWRAALKKVMQWWVLFRYW